MRETKFFGTVMACVLALLLAVFAASAKPPWAGAEKEYGYARLTDVGPYVVWSDDGLQYIDKNIEDADGEDEIEITINKKTGELVKSKTLLGIVNDPYNSSRRVRFLFDIYNGASTTLGEGAAAYDILVWTDISRSTRRDLNAGDGTVHFRVMDDVDDVAFIVDPGWEGTDPAAITQTTVNNFYPDPNDDETYKVSVNGHVIYYLDYPSGITAEGTNPTWTIGPSGSPTLYVLRQKEEPMGKSGKVRTSWERMDLATYGSIPFQLTISLDSLEGNQAPGSLKALSTLWGKIKATR